MEKKMKQEIKSTNKKVLFSGNFDSLKLAVVAALKKRTDLRYADLRDANLRYADLRCANLRSADLRDADLYGADLYGADLHSTDLHSANLRSANLRDAMGINKLLTTPLYMLQDQIGKIRAYKLTNSNGTGPYYPQFVYKVGETYKENNADTNENTQCSAGISLATMDWCLKEWKPGYRIFIAEFTRRDIACIPVGSDGKFRVSQCKIVAEKNLKDIGLEN
jgi:uncharacterized protein YjbI with pentapeptide repeats